MWHALKLRIEPYFDVLTQVINSPKAPPFVAPTLIGFGIIDINNALQTISVLVGLIVGGVSLWVMIEKRTHDKRRRKEESKLRELRTKKLQMETSAMRTERDALANHIKRKNGKG